MSFQTCPPNPVADLRLAEPGTLQLIVVPPQENTVQSELTPLQDQFTVQGNAYTFPGPVYCPR